MRRVPPEPCAHTKPRRARRAPCCAPCRLPYRIRRTMGRVRRASRAVLRRAARRAVAPVRAARRAMPRRPAIPAAIASRAVLRPVGATTGPRTSTRSRQASTRLQSCRSIVHRVCRKLGALSARINPSTANNVTRCRIVVMFRRFRWVSCLRAACAGFVMYQIPASHGGTCLSPAGQGFAADWSCYVSDWRENASDSRKM